MSEQTQGGSYLHFDNMTWPNPDDPTELEWRCRYNPRLLTQTDFYVLASIIAAYRQLIDETAVRRSQKIAGLRAAREAARRG